MTMQHSGIFSAWPGLVLSVPLILGVATPSWAVGHADLHIESRSPLSANQGQRHRYTLKQLGANYSMNLRGTEGSDSVSFDVRADEVVTRALLHLEYSYSPALLGDISQINVLVNDQLAASLAVPKETAGISLKKVVEIPPYLITEFNRLRLQLIGHYTMQCEDPLHSSLWAKIDNRSQLELQVESISLPNDLDLLPLPFFDKRDARLLELPFVFASRPDASTLEAAGTVSSWFGAMASYRGAKFPVSFGVVPKKGNAIVLLNNGQKVIEGVDIPEKDAPHLTLVSNPNDPYGKLLVISGKDGEQLKQAALALVSGNQTLSGSRIQVEQATVMVPRKPYDAPNWLPSDRPVQLGELVEAKKLSVSGYDPGSIKIGMRLPPDLFDWRKDGVPLQLKYRYTPQPVSTNSSLLVSVGKKFIKSLPLPSIENLKEDESLLKRLTNNDDGLVRESNFLLPLASLPLQADLNLRFMYDYIKQGECRDVIIDNMRGTIEPDSTLDISDYEHFVAMPNLGIFQSSGFPFTRMADLSETAVVMPENAGAEEIGTFLAVLGHFGDSTGLPASALTVAQGRDESVLKGKDLLVLASGDNQPLLERWSDYLSASFNGNQQRFKLSDLAYRVRDWFSTDEAISQYSVNTSLATRGGNASAYLTGFESPLDKGRSVVVIASSSPDRLSDLTNALIDGEEYSQSIQGSLAVINGKQISSLVAEEQYFTGDLGRLRYLQWLMSRHVGWLLLLTALGVGLASLLVFSGLRSRAHARLNE